MRTNLDARWTVDELGADAAAVAVEGRGLRYVARRLLPPAARPGDVVRVSVGGAEPGTRTVHLRVDAAASAGLAARVRGALARLGAPRRP